MALRPCSTIMRATAESSAASTTVPGGILTAPTIDSSISDLCSLGITSRKICSTSSTWASRVFSALPSSRAMLVTNPPPLFSADSTCFHSSRTISFTSSTANAWVVRANSVTSKIPSPCLGVQPTTAGRLMTVIIWPRILATPITEGGMLTMAVISGMTRISRTLNTLMPNNSRRVVPGASPKRNSSNSNMLLAARLVRSSMSRMDVFMASSEINGLKQIYQA